jgi:hypothetical protein
VYAGSANLNPFSHWDHVAGDIPAITASSTYVANTPWYPAAGGISTTPALNTSAPYAPWDSAAGGLSTISASSNYAANAPWDPAAGGLSTISASSSYAANAPWDLAAGGMPPITASNTYAANTSWDNIPANRNYQLTTTSFDQLLFPLAGDIPILAASNTNANSMFNGAAVTFPAGGLAPRRSNIHTNPQTCNYPGCGKVTARQADFARHRLQHGTPHHSCLVHACNRRGPKAFYRADRLRDHQRKKHGMVF